MWWKPKLASQSTSIAMRLTIFFAASATFSLLLLGLLINFLVDRHFNELDGETLHGKLELVRNALNQSRTPGDLDNLPQTLAAYLVGHPGLSVIVAFPEGRVLYSTPESAELPAGLLRGLVPAQPGRAIAWTTSGNRHFQGLSAPAFSGVRDAPPLVMVVGIDVSRHEAFLKVFLVSLWMIVCCAAGAIGLTGAFIARRELAPLRSLGDAVSTITARQLNYRVTLASVPDELVVVARAFNHMIERMEESFRALSAYASDLAHELRTPINTLLMQTQVILNKPRDAAAYRDVLSSNLEELARISRTIEDMLYLAKAENRLLLPRREAVDLAFETRQIIDYYRGLAEDKGITLEWAGSGRVEGDKLMLGRAINNLVSNAVKYTSQGGWIRVHIHDPDQAMVRLTVVNTGTVPAEDLASIFDRFFRSSRPQPSLADGTGLGLAITRSIMRAHEGDVVVRCENGVTTFELRFPA